MNLENFKAVAENALSKINELVTALDKAITDFVLDAGGNVKIYETESESCMLYYIDDENYDQVERVFVNDVGDVMVETNHAFYTLDCISVNDKQHILEWMINQVEDPEYYGIDSDEDEDDEFDF